MPMVAYAVSFIWLYAQLTNVVALGWLILLAAIVIVRVSYSIPIAFLTCNFSKPVGDKPALFTHDEF